MVDRSRGAGALRGLLAARVEARAESGGAGRVASGGTVVDLGARAAGPAREAPGRTGSEPHPFPEPQKRRPRVLLLQGPVGPFFKRLQRFLDAEGFDVWRVCFNSGDHLFAPRYHRIGFWGNRAEWRAWLDQVLGSQSVDYLVLFGSDRPAHRIARELAPRHGVHVVSLEEGYIRPGHVTVEADGNNANSPIAGTLPPPGFPLPEPSEPNDFRSLRSMFGHGAFYYLVRTLSAVGRQRDLYHREISAIPELFYWARNGWRRARGTARDFAVIERLLEHCDGRYFLVPLQVARDSNLRDAALGWNSVHLVSHAIRSFADTAPARSHLVFKIHPMDRGHSTDRALIRATAAMLGVADRVHVLDTGSIGLLTRHAAGMITINSTSGLSAIYHGVPLLVIGRAFYAHPALATCADGAPDFERFWAGGPVAPASLRQAYLAWVRQTCLKPGDFYAPRGFDLACQGVLARMTELAQSAEESGDREATDESRGRGAAR